MHDLYFRKVEGVLLLIVTLQGRSAHDVAIVLLQPCKAAQPQRGGRRG